MTKYYHGANRRSSYFEGWYLKYQTKDGRALALIPAFHIDRDSQRSASLQVITEDSSWWLRYPENKFAASERHFHIQAGDNGFREDGIHLNAECDGLSLKGVLHHGPFATLESDIMGPFRFTPGMECYHGVLSMGHTVSGALSLNGEILDFSGGNGYIETDRGRSFPDAYFWTQCSWQSPRAGSLMLSIATIPAWPLNFTGCICAVIHEGREYRLATYRGVHIEQWSESGAVIRQGRYRLAVEVLENRKNPLKAPVQGSMGRIIHESLCAKVRCCFWEGERLLFDHTDSCAGFEFSDPENG